MKVDELLRLANVDEALNDKGTAHLTINLNKVVSKNIVPGLHIDTRETKDGVDVNIVVDEGVVIEKQVHMCFGITHEKALQKIVMNIDIHDILPK